MRGQPIIDAARDAGRFGALVLLGAAAAGCREDRPQTSPPVITSAVVAPPTVVEPSTVPTGWRGIKLGMSEADAKTVIQEYRKDATIGWERAERTYLPTVRFDTRQIDDVRVDSKRFREWSIRDLDDGAEIVHAWHEHGVLIAIRVRGKASPSAFSRKATEAYGPPSEVASFKFSDDRTKVQEEREVTIWRGPNVTAFVWAAGSAPILLLWSTAPMDRCAAEYRGALGAPAEAARKAAQESEDGTKF